MKKNNVLNKILCVFKPKKMPSDILTEAENIINRYISDETDFAEQKEIPQKHIKALNIIIISTLTVIGYIALRGLIK